MKTHPIPRTNKEVVEVDGHFDSGYALLQKEKAALMTAEDFAAARITLGFEHPVCIVGNWVAEGMVFLPDGDVLVVSSEHNSVLRHPKEAADAHRRGQEYFLGEKEAEELARLAEEDPEKAIRSGVLLVRRNNMDFEVPTADFNQNTLTKFLFRNQAKPFGEFLLKHGVQSMPNWAVCRDYAEAQGRSFARALWIRGVSSRSGLDSEVDGAVLCNDLGKVRGVRIK